MKDPIKIKATVPTAKVDVGVSKSSVQVGIDQRVVVPRLDDYFEWRQQTFDPLYHWPLTDGEGATHIQEYDGGPEGEIQGAVFMGSESIIKPKSRYSSLRIDPDFGGSVEIADADVDFVHRTGIFTVALWIQVESTGAGWICGTGGPQNDTPPAWSLYTSGHLDRVFFAFHDGVSSSVYSFLRGDVNRSLFYVQDHPRTLMHLVAVGDGKRIRLYADGGAVMTDGDMDLEVVDEPSVSPFTLMQRGFGSTRQTRGLLQGVLIDDRPWSTAEIRADYERGLGAVEIDKIRLDDEFKGEGDFDDLIDDDLMVSYQFKYPIYNGENSLFRLQSIAEPMIEVGDRLAMCLPHAGSGPPGVSVSYATKRIWTGEGVVSPDGNEGIIQFGEVGDFDFIHSGTARLVIEIYVDPSDDNRRTLAFTRTAGTHTGFWWAYEINNDRMSWNLSGAPVTLYSSNLGITEPGWYRFEVRTNEIETSFYVDGELISSSPVAHDLDQGTATRELRIGTGGFGLSGYEREIRSFSVYTDF